MKAPSGRHIWMLVISSVILLAAVLLLCPPNLFHARHPSRSYLRDKPRYLTAARGSHGRLAVVSRQHGRERIYVDHGGQRFGAVTHGTLDADPAWDPTDTRLAYVSLRQRGTLALRVCNLADGGSDTELLQDALISQPRWSRDGTTIFFLKSRLGTVGQSTIYALNPQTRQVRAVADTMYNRPFSWDLMSEDQIVYTNGGAVWIKPTGTPAKRLPISFTNPCMVTASPDDRLLLVCDTLAAKDKLAVVVDLHGLRRRLIYRGFIRYGLWSPSGRYLAVVGERETWLFRAKGGAASVDGWQLATKLKGNAVCWRSDSALLLVRPNMLTPYFLDEDDVDTGSTVRLQITGG